ncbi:hypothetical protein PoB_003017500 [Plakobranchus ocellatus]|uniref:Uncharacterized protein n=1 Tax=Plakobranchus ocellatus TaxID=259542 RepID=A0AAV4A681_9GAST|nr:hypothetical protein PoB_003017500 [Plakobranchus ocellatus]
MVKKGKLCFFSGRLPDALAVISPGSWTGQRWLIWWGSWPQSKRSEVRIPVRAKSVSSGGAVGYKARGPRFESQSGPRSQDDNFLTAMKDSPARYPYT